MRSYSALRRENTQTAPWVLEWMFNETPANDVLKARLEITAELHELSLPESLNFETQDVPDRDWLTYSYKQFPAFSVGPFFIFGSHHKDSVPDGQYGLQIDAATAFGSASTARQKAASKRCSISKGRAHARGMCWIWARAAVSSPSLRGSSGKHPFSAVDNDPESIAVTERHALANKVKIGKGNLRMVVSEGFTDEAVSKRGPYDLIIANILPAPLKVMAKDLVKNSDENGYIILSGILNEQAEDVLETYLPLGLHHRKTIQNNEWTTLLLQNSTQ